MSRNPLLLAFATIGLILGEVAMAIEEPAFEKLQSVENIEMRQYRPVIVAETFVDGDMGSASNDGFRLIADYIFGNKRFTREFKLEAVRLLEQGIKPAAQLARELGVPRNRLYKWQLTGLRAFSGKVGSTKQPSEPSVRPCEPISGE